MRVVYFGTSVFAVPALEVLTPHLVAVVSQPDRPSGRGMKLQPSPVKQRALDLGLSVHTPERARNPEFVEWVRSLEADILIVAAYGQILSLGLLEAAKQGGINLHGSILPEYRGAAPIQRCILDGRTETGVALMQMDRGMDTGDVIAIEKVPIDSDVTYGELQDRLAVMAAQMTSAWLPRLASGDYPRTPQSHEAATLAPKIDKTETLLDFGRDARQEYNRFRAFTPAPGASISTKFGPVRLSEAGFSPVVADPGRIVEVSPNSITVAFKQGSIELRQLQPAGKKRTSGGDFANGHRLKIGDNLMPETLD